MREILRFLSHPELSSLVIPRLHLVAHPCQRLFPVHQQERHFNAKQTGFMLIEIPSLACEVFLCLRESEYEDFSVFPGVISLTQCRLGRY